MIWLLAPWTYPFMRTALGVSVFVGIVCAVLSCFLILKGWALMGDAVSHAVLPGVVIAYIVGLPVRDRRVRVGACQRRGDRLGAAQLARQR